MGQKSRSKKNKGKNLFPKQNSGEIMSGANIKNERGLTLAGLESGFDKAGRTSEKINIQNISYEMIGNLYVDIKRIGLLLLISGAVLFMVYILKENTPYVKNISSTVASFLNLS